MSYQNFIVSTLKKTWAKIKKHKWLFLVLFLVQLAYLVAFSYTTIYYQLEIFEDLEMLTNPLDTLNLDEQSLQEGDALISEAYKLQAGYSSMIKNILRFFGWVFLLFFTVNFFIWIGSNYLVSKGWNKDLSWKRRAKSTFQTWLKMFVVSVGIFLPYWLISYFLTITFVSLDTTVYTKVAKLFFSVAAVLSYVVLVGHALAPIKSWKKFLKSIIKVAFKKIHFTIFAFVVLLLLFVGSAYLIYYSTIVLINFPLMLFSLIILILVFLLTKIYLIVVCHEVLKLK